MNVLLENVGATKLEFVNTGDLNCELLKQSLENHTKHFVYKCEIHQLSQHIKKPTRIIPYSRTLFDMILTSNPNKIVEHNVKAVGIADHCLVYCVTSFKSHVPTERDRTIEIRYFKQFHIDDFILDLEHCSWSSVKEYDDVNEAYTKWKHIFTEVCNKHCPFTTRCVRKTILPWIDDEIKKDIRI